MDQRRQQDIGFEHKERSDFALVRSLTSIRDSGIGKGRLNGVRKLLETLLVCSTDYVSYARETVIAAKAVGAPVTDRTVRNWIRDAKALGVLSIDPRPGQATSAKRIQMNRLRELVRPSTRQEKISGRQESRSGRQEKVSSLRISPFESPIQSPPPPRLTTESKSIELTTSAEVEESLISEARKLGLFDVDSVWVAFAKGWTAAQIGDLFKQFEQHRRRWDESVRSPCGLLNRWLRTLLPTDPIPWPDLERQPVRPRETSEHERADKLATNLRFELKRQGVDSGTIETTIRQELRKQQFSPEVCREVGYSLDTNRAL